MLYEVITVDDICHLGDSRILHANEDKGILGKGGFGGRINFFLLAKKGHP